MVSYYVNRMTFNEQVEDLNIKAIVCCLLTGVTCSLVGIGIILVSFFHGE